MSKMDREKFEKQQAEERAAQEKLERERAETLLGPKHYTAEELGDRFEASLENSTLKTIAKVTLPLLSF